MHAGYAENACTAHIRSRCWGKAIFTGRDRVDHPRNALHLLAPLEAHLIQTRELLHHGPSGATLHAPCEHSLHIF